MSEYGLLLNSNKGREVFSTLDRGLLRTSQYGDVTVPHATSVTDGDDINWTAGSILVDITPTPSQILLAWVNIDPSTTNQAIAITPTHWNAAGELDQIALDNYHQTVDTIVRWIVFKYDER